MEAKKIFKIIGDAIILLIHLWLWGLIILVSYISNGFDEISRIETPFIDEIYPIIFGPLVIILSCIYIIKRTPLTLLCLFIATIVSILTWWIIASFYDVKWMLLVYVLVFIPILFLKFKKEEK